MLPAFLKRILINRYTLFLAVLYAYHVITDPLIEMNPGIYRMEIPFLLYLYFCLNLFIKESKWQPWIAAIPLVIVYAIHDYYFFRFFRIAKLNDAGQIPELLGVAGLEINLLLFLLVSAILVLLARNLRITRQALLIALPAVLVLVSPFAYPSLFIQTFSALSAQVIHYAALNNVETNGRLTTALYNEARRREIMSHMSSYQDQSKLSLTLPEGMEQPAMANGHNIHVIVLEGFLDPSLFLNLPRKFDVLHPDFVKEISPHLGLSTSPVFGGYTAQAEFEVLCGVPAFQEFDEIEFNVFTGTETYCLPNILRRMGYHTSASNGFKPDFFNTMPAYRGLGFDVSYFPKEYTPTLETYLTKGERENNQYFFDSQLYEQNLAYVKKMMEDKKPFLNYLLTVYGHYPFGYDRWMGPPLVTAPDLTWDLERIFNQVHYRSLALTQFLRQLRALDPESLIVLVADHLPPLTEGVDAYARFGYLPAGTPDRFYRNRVLVYRDGQPQKLDPFYHFNLYRLILDYVTQGEYCKKMPCDFSYPLDKEKLRDDYRIIIGLGARQ